jgi:hypothetical protein
MAWKLHREWDIPAEALITHTAANARVDRIAAELSVGNSVLLLRMALDGRRRWPLILFRAMMPRLAARPDQRSSDRVRF